MAEEDKNEMLDSASENGPTGLTDMEAPPAEEGQVPTGSTITVNGIVYAVSLFWQPLQDPDNPLAEIRETAAGEEGSDLYCIRQSGTYQYGLAKSSEGHREGQIAVAISIADAFSDRPSLVGVFRVKEGWWFIAIRNDVILSEEDVLYLNEEDAQRAFYAMMAVPDWGRKIAPSEWGIEGTQEIPLAEILKRSSQVRLVRLNSAKNTKVLIGMVVGLVLLIFLVVQVFMSFWSDSDIKKQQEKQVVAPVAQVVPEVVVPKPWEEIVHVPDFARRCEDIVKQLNVLTVPGWALDKVTCTQQDIKIEWVNSWNPGGRIAWLRSAFKEYEIQNVELTIDDAGEKAEGVYKLEGLRKYTSDPSLSMKELRENLVDISQAINNPIRLTEQSLTLEGRKKEVIKFIVFSFDSEYTPTESLPFFEKFSGLDLTKIEYNSSQKSTDKKWKYEGRIYEK